MEKFKPYAFSLFAGILFALGYPSIFAKSLLITPLVGTGILFYFVLGADSLKIRILHLLAFNFTFNLFGFYWIAKTLVEFGALPYPIAVLLSTLFTLIITPHLWAAIFVIHYLSHKLHFLKHPETGLYAFSLSAFLTLFEYVIPQQFDVMLGQSWVILGEYLGFASIAGLPIYSFFCYLLVFESLNFIKNRKYSKFNSISIILFIILNPIIGNSLTLDSNPLNIRVVQANISNFLKMESEQGGYASTGQVIDRYRVLSLAKYETGKKLDLIIWPETAYPFAVKTNKEDISYSYTPSVFNEVAQTQDAEMLAGGYDIKNSDHNETLFKTEYNTAFQVSKNGKLKNSYHKQILIPFGETLPFGSFINELLSKYIENISFFSEGEKFTLFNLDSGHKLITTICYELLKPEFIRSYLNSLNERPHAMINLTNDSWYGDTMEPEQHLFLAKWRALEFNLPIIRSTNTGITSVIYPDGSESKRLEVLKTGNLDLSINLPLQEATFYQKFGFATILPLWIIYLIFHLLLLKLKHDK